MFVCGRKLTCVNGDQVRVHILQKPSEVIFYTARMFVKTKETNLGPAVKEDLQESLKHHLMHHGLIEMYLKESKTKCMTFGDFLRADKQRLQRAQRLEREVKQLFEEVTKCENEEEEAFTYASDYSQVEL